jgi:PAS domain-containing protein
MAKRTIGRTQSIAPRNASSKDELRRENEQLRAELAEAQETLRAIQSGDVDAVIVNGPVGEQVFTLRGAEYAYRALVESMNEGAATISANGVVLYCNGRIAPLVKTTSEKVIGRPIRPLVVPSDVDLRRSSGGRWPVSRAKQRYTCKRATVPSARFTRRSATLMWTTLRLFVWS